MQFTDPYIHVFTARKGALIKKFEVNSATLATGLRQPLRIFQQYGTRPTSFSRNVGFISQSFPICACSLVLLGIFERILHIQNPLGSTKDQSIILRLIILSSDGPCMKRVPLETGFQLPDHQAT